jgi:hypothetical protein
MKLHQGEKLTIHPDFWLGVQSIDPFQGFDIADLSKISLGRREI